ncbi:hypothetical protein [Allomuricauda sp. d1]|uniref:hypothetical protein n=1 Tax=Allomuricauda sp. d1 TaxID=3136725 RepID=UPI0031D92C08
MERKIKLIWDFRGPAAAKTAEHHEKHLAEFLAIEQLTMNITGHLHYSNMHSVAYMVVTDDEMKQVRNQLKPHRGEVYEES